MKKTTLWFAVLATFPLIFAHATSALPVNQLDAGHTAIANSLPVLKVSQFEGNGNELNWAGRSLGGNMRSGPGTQYGKVRGLAEGTWLTIVSNTGVRFDGYDWFEVVLDNGTRGYQWGGILCSNGERIPGIYAQCGDAPAQAASAGWLSFAVGNNEIWGHGAGATKRDAERFAIDNCPSSSCRIVATTQSRCQALALAPGQNWISDASNENGARSNAMNFCSRHSSQCRIEYSYCQ